MAKNNHQDQTRYCEHCGISFLWSAEEQRHTSGVSQIQHSVPTLCPGCRYLLPQGKRERGLVKWYNTRRRYGFLVRDGQPEIFVHGSDVEGHSRLRPGALVEFTVSETERGAAAKSVQVLGNSTKDHN